MTSHLQSGRKIKLVYVTSSLDDHSLGVKSKIHRQIEELNQQGVEAMLMEYELSLRGILKANLRLRQELRDEGATVFCRYPTPFIFLTPFIFPSIRGRPLILELNSIYEREFAAEDRSFAVQLVTRLLGPRILSLADGAVAVTEEIREFYIPHQSDIVVIGNGFDVSSVPLRKATNADHGPVEVIMVANFSRWHGVERLVESIALMDEVDNIVAHLAGSGREADAIAALVAERGLEGKVIMHGPKEGENLDRLFDRSQAAVGSLGLHRMNLSQASTLKAREYCARGIPLVTSVDDADLPSELPFVLRVPADDSPLDMDALLAFIEAQEPDVVEKMRRHAEGCMDWSVKVDQLATYLRRKAKER